MRIQAPPGPYKRDDPTVLVTMGRLMGKTLAFCPEIRDSNPGPLPAKMIRRVWSGSRSGNLALQKPGVVGWYSYMTPPWVLVDGCAVLGSG